jgi:hypothetical protein
MKQLLVIPAMLAILTLSGCEPEPIYAPAPPPPPVYTGEVPPLVRLAERNGYRAGFDDGGRDAYYHAGYTPRRDEKYRDAPGYDYRLGPSPPYVDSFRSAYLRGYDNGYYGRQDDRGR